HGRRRRGARGEAQSDVRLPEADPAAGRDRGRDAAGLRHPDGRFDDRRTSELMRPRQAARAACRTAARRCHMWKWTAILPALVLAGCAHEYTYQPTEHATGSIGGHVAADYEIP